jgi:hypothetical protein
MGIILSGGVILKKCFFILLLSFFLTGCGSEATFETVADEWVQSAAAPVREILVTLPQEAAVSVSESEFGCLYQCDGYEIALQTLEAGDLDTTLRTVTGYSRENLTVMETRLADIRRYDLVWSCMGEQGELVGRARVLDDGNYHYVLTVLAQANRAAELEGVIADLFRSYSLS